MTKRSGAQIFLYGGSKKKARRKHRANLRATVGKSAARKELRKNRRSGNFWSV